MAPAVKSSLSSREVRRSILDAELEPNIGQTEFGKLYNRLNLMPTIKSLDEHYRTLSDEEIFKLAAGGGLTDQAEQVLRKELARRNLTSDETKRYFTAQWLEKAGAGTVGAFVLKNGDRITAEVVGLNEEEDRLSVKVVSLDNLSRNGLRTHRAIPLHQIVSFEPQLHLMEQWPFSDPCRHRSSHSRLLLMSVIFLCMTVGSLPLFLLLISRPYGLQEASIIAYTLFEVFFTFATTGNGPSGGNVPGYKFTCPAVKPRIPHLLWRHLGFLVVLFVLQTAMLAVRQHLPDWWNMRDRKGATPFDAAIFLLCFSLGWAHVRNNRFLLNRAHRGFLPRHTG